MYDSVVNNHRRSRPPSVLNRVLHAAHVLEGRLEAALGAEGLSMAKAGALLILAEAGEPLTLGALAERNHCVRSNVTQLVDRLEKDGLVRRVPDASDRRVRRAALTARGHRAVGAAKRVWTAFEREVGASVGRGEGAVLDRVLGRIRA
jgi:DNA-binding MarR family transcriptional regulator